jgi:hypothetical protein
MYIYIYVWIHISKRICIHVYVHVYTGLSADKSFYSTSTSSSFMSFIISLATIATMLGKFLLGPPTDYFGKWTTFF